MKKARAGIPARAFVFEMIDDHEVLLETRRL
jgi:hypothetical protein